jgi:flavodoxin
MRAVIVYESMFGNTHAIADSVGKGPRTDARSRRGSTG